MRRRRIETWLLAACDPATHSESPCGRLSADGVRVALAAARSHNVLGSTLRSADRWQQDATHCDEFRQQHLVDVGKTLGLRLIAQAVTQRLSAAGIPCCLLKGEDFASRLYPNPALRPYRDVDVLVPLAAMNEADRLIRSMGYEPVEPERKYQAHEYGQISYFASGPERWSLELHWNIINSPAQRQVCSLTLEDFDVVASSKFEGAWQLSPTSLLVLAAVHACIGHRFDSLQQLCDIRQICRGAAGPIDVQRLADMCRLRGCETPLRWSLDLASRLLGCDYARELAELCSFSSRAARPFGMLGRQTVLRPQTALSRLRRSWARSRLKLAA